MSSTLIGASNTIHKIEVWRHKTSSLHIFHYPISGTVVSVNDTSRFYRSIQRKMHLQAQLAEYYPGQFEQLQ